MKSAFALIFSVLLFVPMAISFEMTSASQRLELVNDGVSVSGPLTIAPAAVYAAGDFMAQSTTIKKDAAGSKWYVELATTLGNMLLGIGAFFAWATGNILDKSLKELVFGMGDLINKGGVGLAIDSAWKIIRDLCNLAFIFGFIYLGIRTIIDPDSSSVKKTLSQIIMGALLINFSLYIAKFIIDFSNFTAYSIYNAMVTGNGSISQLMFDLLGVGTFYSTNQMNAASFQQVTGSGMLAFYLMGMLLLLVAAFVFLAAAILLITRFVALVFLMIASPVLFAATVFPQTAGTAKMLWGKLFSYSFFAPLYLLLTLISMLIMKSFVSVMAGNQQLSATFSESATGMDAFGVVVSFIVMIFFLVNSLLIAKSLGIRGGDTMIGWGQKLKGNTQSFVGRNTVGRIGNGIASWQENARYNGGTGSKAAAAAARWTGVNAAANAAANATYGGSKSRKTAENEQREVDRKHAKAQEVQKISSAVSESTRLAEKREDVEKDTSATPAQKDAARKASEDADMRMERALAGASTEQTLDLLKKHKSGAERNAIVANLSASQFDSVMKSKPEDLDDAKKDELRSQRSAAVQKRLVDTENRKRTAAGTPPTATIGDVIGKADAKELDAMNFETVVLANAGKLSSKQVDDMSLTPTAKNRLKNARNTALVTEFTTSGAGVLFGRITSETERAKLPKDILTNPTSAEFLTQGVLTKMLDNDGVPMGERPNIRANVEAYHRGKPTEKNFKKFFNNTPAGQQYI